MKKMLTAIAFVTVAVGLGGTAGASSYPPGSPGTITVAPPTCEYLASGPTDFGGVKSWSLTVQFNVSAANAVLSIAPTSGGVVWSEPVPIGAGERTVRSDTDGFAGVDPYLGFDVELLANGTSVKAKVVGCPIPTGGGDSDTGGSSADGKSTSGNKSTSDKSSTGQGSTTELPATGAASNAWLAGLAGVLLGAGIALVRVARRGGSVPA